MQLSTTLLPLLLLLALGVSSSPHSPRIIRQIWSFPGEETSTTSRWDVSTRRTTARPTTTRRSQTTTSPGVIFQLPDCDCPAPPQYNPVCGTDGNTYSNLQKLNCARQCGAPVRFERLGPCNTRGG